LLVGTSIDVNNCPKFRLNSPRKPHKVGMPN
jgi:hypothetical protein